MGTEVYTQKTDFLRLFKKKVVSDVRLRTEIRRNMSTLSAGI